MLWALAVRQRGRFVMECPALAVTHDRSTAAPHVALGLAMPLSVADAASFFDSLAADVGGYALYKALDGALTR